MSLPHNHGADTEKVQKNLPSDENLCEVAELLALMADPSRVKIFWILCHCEECVINLSAMTEMSSPALSHHLKLLRSAGLISSSRHGKEVYYKAAENTSAKHLHAVIEGTMSIVCPICE